MNKRERRKVSNRRKWLPFTYYGKNLQSRVKEISESNVSNMFPARVDFGNDIKKTDLIKINLY